MRRDWPFFAVVLENAEVSLAKADRELAARYLARAPQSEIWDVIVDEWDRTRATPPRCHGSGRAPGRQAIARSAIAVRAPYVDALSNLQLRFLDEPRATRLVQSTIAGVAAGLQNTG